MDFEFTPEQIQLRHLIRDFAEAEIAPHVLEWDENQIFPLEVIRRRASWAPWGRFSQKSWAARASGISNIRLSLRSSHGWIRVWRSLWRRIIRCAPTIFIWPGTTTSEKNIYRS